MEPDHSLLHSQMPTTCPYPEHMMAFVGEKMEYFDY
jgi:hypothetical protein